MTIETRKAANVNEALEILNSLLPNGTFEYNTENYSNDYKTTYRHFDATAENGATCYGMIEFVENGNLVKARFVNIYRETAVDIEIENFTSGVANVENNAKMTIESKIAANGRVMYFAVDENGKKSRVKATAAVVIECAIQTRDAYRAKVAAKLDEEINAIDDYAVSVEAQDAATDAEIELANAGNDELDENNVDDADKITVESAQANGLSFEEFMAARAGLTLDEYLAKQAKEEEAIKAHQLNLKIKALKNSVMRLETNIASNVGTINDIFNNHWKIGTDDDFEEYANELAAEIADNLNQIAKLNAKLADLVPNVEINPADYAVSAEAQDAATDAEIGLANAYQPQTNWENPHDFTTTGDLSGRNLYGRIIAQCNAKEEKTLTDNMKLAQKITDKLGTLLVKFSHAGEGKNGGLALHYDTFKDEHDEFGTLTHFVEVFTDQTNFILDHVNFITGYGVDKTVEQFFFKHDGTNTATVKATFEIGKAYFNRDFRDCAFTILDRKKNIVTFALKDFEDDEVYIQRARIRKDSRGEFFITKAEVLINTWSKIEIYAADLLTEVPTEQTQEPTNKQTNGKATSHEKPSDTSPMFVVGRTYLMHTCNIVNEEITVPYKVINRGKVFLTVDGRSGKERYKIRNTSEGEFLERVYDTNSGMYVDLYAKDIISDELKPPANKQIVDSLTRAIDKAKLEYKIAFISGNQSQANFERELYLIAAKALRELKH